MKLHSELTSLHPQTMASISSQSALSPHLPPYPFTFPAIFGLLHLGFKKDAASLLTVMMAVGWDGSNVGYQCPGLSNWQQSPNMGCCFTCWATAWVFLGTTFSGW
eukprot:s608_g17.t1